jgi:hypothetical protein
MHGIWAQRVFAPWHDLAGQIIGHNIPLTSLEEGRPIARSTLWDFLSSTSSPSPPCSV